VDKRKLQKEGDDNMVRVLSCLFILLAINVSLSRAEEVPVSVHSFSMKANDGKVTSLADYKGKVLLIVNTASRCGFTPQYKGLEELYQRYRDMGFVVLAFPANDFMGQEPGTDQEIKNFCELKYNITFPLFARSSVKGAEISPLFRYLTEGSNFPGPVTWNFNKFLVDRNGQVAARFDSRVTPLSEELELAIKKELSH
jgi:glutathione peroxidase